MIYTPAAYPIPDPIPNPEPFHNAYPIVSVGRSTIVFIAVLSVTPAS